MHDEFRVEADVDEQQGSRLLAALEATEVADDVRQELGVRVVVTHDGGHVFMYADSIVAAERARASLEDEMRNLSVHGTVAVTRWHPLEERWEDAKVPLPDSDEARAAELERRAQDEDADSLAAGQPEWEVRVSLADRGQAHDFAERLEAEGIPTQRRWRHVMVGALDEQQAAELAERLRGEAPEGSEIHVEGSGAAAWRAMHPFAIFGGIAN